MPIIPKIMPLILVNIVSLWLYWALTPMFKSRIASLVAVSKYFALCDCYIRVTMPQGLLELLTALLEYLGLFNGIVDFLVVKASLSP